MATLADIALNAWDTIVDHCDTKAKGSLRLACKSVYACVNSSLRAVTLWMTPAVVRYWRSTMHSPLKNMPRCTSVKIVCKSHELSQQDCNTAITAPFLGMTQEQRGVITDLTITVIGAPRTVTDDDEATTEGSPERSPVDTFAIAATIGKLHGLRQLELDIGDITDVAMQRVLLDSIGMLPALETLCLPNWSVVQCVGAMGNIFQGRLAILNNTIKSADSLGHVTSVLRSLNGITCLELHDTIFCKADGVDNVLRALVLSLPPSVNTFIVKNEYQELISGSVADFHLEREGGRVVSLKIGEVYEEYADALVNVLRGVLLSQVEAGVRISPGPAMSVERLVDIHLTDRTPQSKLDELANIVRQCGPVTVGSWWLNSNNAISDDVVTKTVATLGVPDQVVLVGLFTVLNLRVRVPGKETGREAAPQPADPSTAVPMRSTDELIVAAFERALSASLDVSDDEATKQPHSMCVEVQGPCGRMLANAPESEFRAMLGSLGAQHHCCVVQLPGRRSVLLFPDDFKDGRAIEAAVRGMNVDGTVGGASRVFVARGHCAAASEYMTALEHEVQLELDRQWSIGGFKSRLEVLRWLWGVRWLPNLTFVEVAV